MAINITKTNNNKNPSKIDSGFSAEKILHTLLHEKASVLKIMEFCLLYNKFLISLVEHLLYHKVFAPHHCVKMACLDPKNICNFSKKT